MRFLLDTSGKYLGQLLDKQKDILVVFPDYPFVKFLGTAHVSKTDIKKALSPLHCTPLTGDSEENPGYQKAINISKSTWEQIIREGGSPPQPIIVNKSTTTVYIKPEGKVLQGPGQILDHKRPIALAPGATIYGRIDGVNTPWKGHKVFKAVDGTRMIVLKKGRVKITSYEKWYTRIGQWWRGGWKDRRKRSSWVALGKVFQKEDVV